jgi:hypothetical protein
MSWPVYCGAKPGAAPACPALATVHIDGASYHAVACDRHRDGEIKKAGPGARVRDVVQPDGARAVNHEPDLFDFLDGAA